MRSARITLSLGLDVLRQVDQLVESGIFPSRSKLIQDAVAEKLRHLRRDRLARECANMEPVAERAASREFFRGEAEWPEY